MKGAYFVFTVWVIAVLAFVGSLTSIEFLHTRLSVNHAYHKALQRAMVSKDFDREFKEVFRELAPKHLTYTISLVNEHQFPRLLTYRVVGTSKRDYVLIFEETMIEERR